jgi:hypothetical protein
MNKTKTPTLYLTLVGGGAFGNKISWILEAIRLCMIKYQNYPLDVKIVSYGSLNQTVEDYIKSVNNSLV